MLDGRNFVFEENPKTEFNPGLASLDAITFAEIPFVVVLYSPTFRPLPPIAMSDFGSWSSNTFPALRVGGILVDWVSFFSCAFIGTKCYFVVVDTADKRCRDKTLL